MLVNVSFFRVSNLSRAFYVLSENAAIGFFGLLLAVSLYTLSSDTLLLSFVSEISTGLDSMAEVRSKTGYASRKTVLDSLWLPMSLNQKIFKGDSLFTESESTLAIKLNETANLFVEPNSFLRFREVDGKPLIRLSRGIVKAEVTDEQIIFIKRGAWVEKVLLQKGTYFIKNDQSAGIQITTYDQNVNLAQGRSEESKKMQSLSSESEEDKFERESQSEKTETSQEAVKTDIADGIDFEFDLPTPRDGTLFLVKNSRSIAVGSMSKCLNSCLLKVYFNQKIFIERSFRINEPAVIKISSDQIKFGNYEWTFETEISQFKAQFSVEEYSDAELSKALENERPVEIHP